MNDHLQRLEFAGALKRLTSTKNFVEHEAETKNVTSCIERSAGNLFRGHVANRPNDDSRSREAGSKFIRRWRSLLGQAEVGKFCISGFGYKNIVRLDIAVQDSGFMRTR